MLDQLVNTANFAHVISKKTERRYEGEEVLQKRKKSEKEENEEERRQECARQRERQYSGELPLAKLI